jgi:hypothetical protein
MGTSTGESSLREHTGRIRHLDAARARRLVGLFARPVVTDGHAVAIHPDDSIAAATDGELTLARVADDGPPTVVGHYKTHLYLHELLRLPLSVARELARHRGHLYLDKLTHLTEAVATELAGHDRGGLSLNNLGRLSVGAALALGRHGGELSLNRLRRLHPDVALGLAAHAHPLYLSGLERLSSATAAALAQHRGDLHLDALATLSGAAARHLARHAGKLHLHGLVCLTDAVAKAFGHRRGFLCIKHVQHLTEYQAECLSLHTGELHLYDLDIDDTVSDLLGRHTGSLSVRLPDTLPLHRLAAIVQHRGPLQLSGIRTIDHTRAAVIAAQPAPHGAAGLSGIFLGDVTTLSPAVAAILATHRAGGLALFGLKAVSEDMARELVKHPILSLDGVASLTDRVAGILATHSGATLSLRGLRHVTAAALATLRANPGIELPRRLLEPPTRPTAAAPPPSRAQLIAAIAAIARRGEEALHCDPPPHDGPA